MLANAGWTNTYRPDIPAGRPYRHPARPDVTDRSGDADQHGTNATSVENVVQTRSARDSAPATPPEVNADAHDVVDEETATALRFVTVALDGGFGDAHQQAAVTAVAVATEHGFGDDPKRVAEALVVFLHPDHR